MTPVPGRSTHSLRRRPPWTLLLLATLAAWFWRLQHGTTPRQVAQLPAQQAQQLLQRGPLLSEEERAARLAQLEELGALQLSRLSVAAKLEQMLDASPLLGPCYGGQPLLPALANHTCESPACFWSDWLGGGVDVADAALQPTGTGGGGDGQAAGAACPRPRGGQLAPPDARPPRVSFVLVLRNSTQAARGLQAARSLLELFLTAGEAESAELIVVSVGAAPGTTPHPAVLAARRLQLLFGTRVVLCEAPDASSAVLQGIKAAAGEYVAVVDANTVVLRGWLGASLATLDAQPAAAAVGPLILGAGNALHDAGGLLDAEGRAAPFARGEKIGSDLYYMRQVDFLSLECLVLRRAAFWQLWGLDTQFTTKRYRAADLGLAAHAAGWRMLLQPLALAFSQAGNASGSSAAEEERDRQRLLYKWGAVLGARHCPAGTDAAIAAGRHGSPRLLWVDDTPPEPDKDSGSIRSLNMLTVLLNEGYHVMLAPSHSPTHVRYAAQIRHLGVQLLPKMEPAQWPLTRQGVGGGGASCAFDVALVARRDVYQAARPALGAACPSMPVVYDTVDLHFLRESRDALTAPPPGASTQDTRRAWAAAANLTTARIYEWLASGDGGAEVEELQAARGLELQLIDASAITVVVSPEEVDMIRRYRPSAELAVVSNVHRLDEGAAAPPPAACAARDGLLFVGNMNHPPNRQALEALVLDVLPRVLRLLPWRERRRLRLHVVASNAVPKGLARLLDKNRANVVFHGYLPDDELLALYNQTKVAVAPLLSGAGVKGKVNQAMKLGVPVVGTPVALEGIQAEDGENAMVASDPATFAAKVVQVYRDCELWDRLAEGGRRNVRQHFSLEAGGPALLEVMNRIGRGPKHSFDRDVCVKPPEKTPHVQQRTEVHQREWRRR